MWAWNDGKSIVCEASPDWDDDDGDDGDNDFINKNRLPHEQYITYCTVEYHVNMCTVLYTLVG